MLTIPVSLAEKSYEVRIADGLLAVAGEEARGLFPQAKACAVVSDDTVAPLYAVDPGLLGHCLAGHVSAEAGHRALLGRMRLDPILDFGMRLGEGSGAALALGILRAAVACHDGMATFAEAGVSDA